MKLPSPRSVYSAIIPLALAGTIGPLAFAPSPVHAAPAADQQVTTYDPIQDLRGDEQARAERGDADAQYDLAIAHLHGIGIDPDPAQARRWFERAAALGHAWSQYELGRMLEAGVGGPKGVAGALTWYREAARQGEPRAAARAGFLLRTGLGVPRDLSEARIWLTKAADQASADAELQLALLALEESRDAGAALAFLDLAASESTDARTLRGFLRQRQKAGRPLGPAELAADWRRESDSRTPEGDFRWGFALRLGIGVQRDEAGAAAALGRAAARGHAAAMAMLAVVLADAPADHEAEAARRWCRRAAELGYGPAQLQMAFYDAMDEAKARTWTRKAAAQGLPEAQARYGADLYHEDDHREEGRRWLEQAAAQGNVAAAHALSSSGELGFSIGPRRLSDEQAKWLRFAAGRGLADAQHELAEHLLDTGGNVQEAIGWLERAAAARHHESAKKLAALYREGKVVPKDLPAAARWILVEFALSGDLTTYDLAALLQEDADGVLPYATILPVLEREAARGNRVALTALAGLRLRGRGVQRDPAAAQAGFARAAKDGDQTAMIALGKMLADGDGVPRDDVAAAQWLERASLDDGVQGKIPLARMVLEGRGCRKDVPRALKLLEEAGNRGLGEAYAELGQLYRQGRDVPLDLAKARRYFEGAVQNNWPEAKADLKDFVEADGKLRLVNGRGFEAALKRRAGGGEAQAQFELGIRLLDAQDEERDVGGGLLWLQKAAEQGHAAAARSLGQRLLHGTSVQRGEDWVTEHRDPAAAAKWVERAGELGDEAAVLMLAGVTGHGLPIEPPTAFRWALKGAEQGLVAAQLEVARRYAEGTGTAVNGEQAKRWALAAAPRDPAGFRQLAYMYEHGEGVPVDLSEAARWLRRAAEAGHKGAAMRLGRVYERGEGVPADPREAIRWYERATEPYDSDGAFAIARLYHRGPLAVRNAAQAHRWYLTAIDYWTEGGDGTETFGRGGFASFAKTYGNLATARLALARRFETGDGLARDARIALTWYQQAARLARKHPAPGLIAWFKAGGLLAGGGGLPAEPDKALEHYRKGAALVLEDERDPFEVLRHVRVNWELDQALPPVIAALRAAAQQGDATAQFQIARILSSGRGLPRNDAAAAAWRSRAAAAGNLQARLAEAVALEDRAKALARFAQAAQPVVAAVDRPAAAEALWLPQKPTKPMQGALQALDKALRAAKLGPYEPPRDGNGTVFHAYAMSGEAPSDATLRDFARSAGVSLPYARFFWATGRLVARASLVKQPAERLRLLREAAALHSPDAMCDLAKQYEAGSVVRKDLTEAYMWYTLSAARGYDEARWAVSRLDKLLPVSLRAKAQALAMRRWEQDTRITIGR